MGFWLFMFLCNLFVPATLILSGKLMQKYCPKKINSIVGYRTKRSMKNMDTWKFAHDYCGRLWWNIGWVMMVLSILIQLPFLHQTDDTVGIIGGIICTVQCIILVLSILPTELALKKTFNEDGTRK